MTFDRTRRVPEQIDEGKKLSCHVIAVLVPVVLAVLNISSREFPSKLKGAMNH